MSFYVDPSLHFLVWFGHEENFNICGQKQNFNICNIDAWKLCKQITPAVVYFFVPVLISGGDGMMRAEEWAISRQAATITVLIFIDRRRQISLTGRKATHPRDKRARHPDPGRHVQEQHLFARTAGRRNGCLQYPAVFRGHNSGQTHENRRMPRARSTYRPVALVPIAMV